jgi:hypothetical protein
MHLGRQSLTKRYPFISISKALKASTSLVLLNTKVTRHEISRTLILWFVLHCIFLDVSGFASGAEEKVIRVFEAHHNFLQKFARICRIHQPISESNIFYRLSHIPILIFIEACWVFLRVIMFKSCVFPINPFTIEPSQKFRKLHIKKMFLFSLQIYPSQIFVT